jgi:hypothetical protein
MIRSVKDLEGFTIDADDGPLGIVTDFYFDAETWVVRYAVVDASSWLGRDVLLSPYSMGAPDWGRGVLPASVTKEQSSSAPPPDDPKTDLRLHGCNAMTGYHLHGNDGEIGHIQGFLIDDHSWSIRYIIVNSTNWWLGHHVLVSPSWIQELNRPRSSVTVNLDREAIKDAPAYDADTDVGRDADVSIYNHYGRNGYWQDTEEGASAQHA